VATPTFTLIGAGGLTDGVLTSADANTGWSDLTTADTDIKVEGTGSMSGVLRADGEQGYYDAGGAPVSASGLVFRGWILTNNLPYMGTYASDPYKLLAYDGTTEEQLALFGSDTYPGGWFYIWQDMDAFTTLTLANVDRWGVESGHASNAKNVVNTWMDVMRYLDGYSFTGGTTSDRVTMADVASVDLSSAYGVTQTVNGVYFGYGTLQIGSGATTTWFEMDGEVLVFVDPPGALSIPTGLYDITATGSGCNCFITGSVIRSGGTLDSTRVVIDLSDTNLNDVEFSSNLVVRASTIAFQSGMTATGNTFDDCGQITHAGANMNDCVIQGYEGTAGTAALVYNVNADPDGEVDGITFTKGTAATHAIEFGSNTPSSVTLRDQTYSGYNASNGQNDSTFYNNTGGALTINLDGASGNATYRNGTGASTTIASDPVTTTITVKDAVSLAVVQNARVYMVASDATGDLPYQESVTITSSGTTATVAHTGHGMASGDFALIEGADQQNYNGCYEITVTGVDAYTYTMPGSATSPATGTITSTGGYFNSLTNASGQVTDSRSITNDQPLAGVARKASAADDPKYKTATLVGDVDNATGLSITTFLARDQ
jgi:hypothetical protein